MGRLYKRGDIWYVDYSHHGKRIRKPVSPKRKEAKQYLLEVEEKILHGEFNFINHEKILSEYIAERKEYFVKTRKSGYAKRCSYIFNHFRNFVERERIKYISSFTKEHADKYTQERLNYIQPKTINDELYIIRWIFESAKEHNYILKNPLGKFKKMKYAPKPHRYFSDKELEIIYNESPEQYRDIYKFLANTGLRIGELAYLEWKDIDLENRLTYIHYKEDWVPKNSQEREIPINDTLYSLIKKIEENSSKEGNIFKLKGRQEKEHLLNNLQKILEKHGFEYGRLHTFRHTFGTKLAQAGVNIYEIQKLLGHSDIRMTQRYARLSKDNLEDAVKKLDK